MWEALHLDELMMFDDMVWIIVNASLLRSSDYAHELDIFFSTEKIA